MPTAAASTPFQKASLQRMVFVGDSITCGVGVTQPETDRFSACVIAHLQKDHPDLREINLGKSGQALSQQPRTHAEDILNENPDAVVIEWGINDQYWGYSVAEFSANYAYLVATLRAARPEMPIVVCTLVADFRRTVADEFWINQANVAIQEIAIRQGAHVAHIHHAFDHNQTWYADIVHPNNAGATVIADTILAALQTPPISASCCEVRFDGGPEVRFLQYSFQCAPNGAESDLPAWTRVSDITPDGMTVETSTLQNIRTAPIYENAIWHVAICDADGKTLYEKEQTLTWERMLDIPLGMLWNTAEASKTTPSSETMKMTSPERTSGYDKTLNHEKALDIAKISGTANEAHRTKIFHITITRKGDV